MIITRIKKLDIILVSCLLVAAAVAYFVLNFGLPHQLTSVTIRQDGKVIYQITEFANKEQLVTVSGPLGDSIVSITDKGVAMSTSPCPDKCCEKQGRISDGVIVCVPQEIIIEVHGKAEEVGYDAILR